MSQQIQAQAQAIAVQFPESMSVATLNALSELFASLATQVANERMDMAHHAASREQVIIQRATQLSERLDVVSSAHQVAHQALTDLTAENGALKTENGALQSEVFTLKNRRPAPYSKGSGAGDDNSEAGDEAQSNVDGELADAPKKPPTVSLEAAARTSGSGQ